MRGRPPAVPSVEGDRESWARLWAIALRAWPRAQDLADLLGVGRTTVESWASGARHGAWSGLREALRETARDLARRDPARVSRLVEELISEVLDQRGRWIPAGDEELGERVWADESEDVHVAHGDLARAVRAGDEAAVERLARELPRELEEAIEAARQAVRRRAAS